MLSFFNPKLDVNFERMYSRFLLLALDLIRGANPVMVEWKLLVIKTCYSFIKKLRILSR